MNITARPISKLSATCSWQTAVAERDSAFAAWADVIGIIDSGRQAVRGTSGERYLNLLRRKARQRFAILP